MTLDQVLLKQFDETPGEFVFGALITCFGLLFMFIVLLIALRLILFGCPAGGYEEDMDDDYEDVKLAEDNDE